MKPSTKEKLKKLFNMPVSEYLLVIFILALALSATWIIVGCIVWLICLCFGAECHWLLTTGIWIILMILGAVSIISY